MESEFNIYNTLSGGGINEKVQIKKVEEKKVDTISDENKNRVKRLREKITLLENEIKKIENNI
jgi:hypothetical protein|tara:strand:+ start:381 stop:569 length:189 start_codon:yes stop_codon:yes gene_type:complete